MQRSISQCGNNSGCHGSDPGQRPGQRGQAVTTCAFSLVSRTTDARRDLAPEFSQTHASQATLNHRYAKEVC